MRENYKEVDFTTYCPLCAHISVPEDCRPCNECLENPVNLNSVKPVKWEERCK